MKPKIALRIKSDNSRKLIDMLAECSEYELAFFIDNNEERWGTIDCQYHLPYISPYKSVEMISDGIIDRVIVSPFKGSYIVKDVLSEMCGMGIDESLISIPSIPYIMEADKITYSDLQAMTYDNYGTLSYLEFHIADNCNMNCALCSHFASLVRNEVLMDYNEMERDLIQLKKFVHHVDSIAILGGEPLLNSDWKKYIELVKSLYQYSEIIIVTNGIKIWDFSESDYQFLIDKNVLVSVSLYKPMWSKADELVGLLKKSGVRFRLQKGNSAISQFESVFQLSNPMNADENRKRCRINDCSNIYHGRMGACPRMMYVSYFNDFFNMNIPEEVSVENIYTLNSFTELMEKLNRSVPMCSLCNVPNINNAIVHEWRRLSDNEEITEWIS